MRAAQDAKEGSSAHAARHEADVPIDEALEKLGEADRSAVLLHCVEGRTHREVGESLNISEEAARKRIARALGRLRQLLTPAGGRVLGAAAAAHLLAATADAAPPSLAAAATSAALAGGASAGAVSMAQGALIMSAVAKTKAMVLVAASVALLAGATTAVIVPLARPGAPIALAALQAAPVAAQPQPPAGEPYVHVDPAYAKFPYPPGFPIVVPGSVSGAPVIADLDGDEKPEIVVPVIGRLTDRRNMYEAEIHPSPSLAGQIFAFRADGSSHPAFPMEIRGVEYRQFRQRIDWYWNFSPSVAEIGENAAAAIIVGGQVLYGDGVHLRLRDVHDAYGAVALADVDHDGELDMLMGWTAQSVRGAPIKGWPRDRSFPPSYGPVVGDADGDGDLEIFQALSHDKMMGGFDEKLKPLPGWPRPLEARVMYPVLGDMDGDGKAEVCAVDENGTLHIWHNDGTPVAACKKVGEIESAFKTGLHSSFTHPALADLDGDGAAEILVLDWETHSIRAWKVDGTPAVPREKRVTDGQLTKLPAQKHSGYGSAGGISVADLGGDGVMDIFAGTTWFKLHKDGKVDQVPMTPPKAQGYPQSTSVPTIADVDQDGLADIIFGTTDGRLFVYNTKMRYEPKWVQWQTQEGNFRHTGHWVRPRQ
jgi:hypothetical protein